MAREPSSKSHAAYARIPAFPTSRLRGAVLLDHTINAPRFLGAKRCQRAQTASFGREPATEPATKPATEPETMAEEKKSRACHYLQPQEWWFEDKTPIACAGA